MPKFLAKCLLALVPLMVICLYTSNYPLTYMDDEAPYYLWNKEKTNAKSEGEFDVLFLGDSAANAAYVPAILSNDSINLALGGITPVDGFYILSEWLDNHPAPKTCYISFADNHFHNEPWFWTRIIFTHRFKLLQNVEILRKAIEYGEESILTQDYISDFICYELWLPNRYITFLKKAKLQQQYQNNLNALQNIERHSGRYMTRGIKEYKPTGDEEYKKFEATPLFDEYYRRILDLCVENQIEIHLVKLPLPDNVIFTKEYKEDLKHYYDELKEDYPGIALVWFEQYEKEYFADNNHLNSRGALKFSTELKNTFPKDFKSVIMSPNSVAAINDEITTENKIEWLLNWIDGKNYTIVIRDSSGCFPQIYEEQIEKKTWNKESKLYSLDLEQMPSCAFYYILGDKSDLEQIPTALYEESIKEKLGFLGTVEENKSGGYLDLLIIDNYNNTVVCKKTYCYVDKEYVYEK